MSSGSVRNYKEELTTGIDDSGLWRAPAILIFVITVMVFLFVILLPDTPFEFW